MIKRSWSQSGKIKAGSDQQINIQKVFEDPGAYTVQFNVQGRDPGNLHDRRTRAEITWSVEGNSVSRIVDVVNGTSVSGTAEAVAVKAYDDTAFPLSNDEYLVSIQVVKGTRPSVQQPPYYTYGRFTLGGGDDPVYEQEIVVPSEAGIISVRIMMFPVFIGSELTDDGNPYNYEVIHSAGSFATAQYSPLLITDWVPIASGTNRINVLQNGLAHSIPMNYCVYFGVDG